MTLNSRNNIYYNSNVNRKEGAISLHQCHLNEGGVKGYSNELTHKGLIGGVWHKQLFGTNNMSKIVALSLLA